MVLRGGLYPRSASFALSAQDSGSASAKVVFRSYPGERARIVGATRLDPSWFAPVTSASPIWSLLDSSAQGKLVQVDLKARGITDYGGLKKRGFGATVSAAPLELFVDGAPMTLARWPDPDQNDPAPTPADATITLYGDPTPDVTGTYVKSGTQDGHNVYQRQGLVAGKQYNLHRHTWTYQGNQHTAWFLTTTASGYPAQGDPFWSSYTPGFASMKASQGGSGSISFRAPDAIRHGFAEIDKVLNDTTFTISQARASRWTSKEIWAHGFWYHAWADLHVKVTAVDAAKKQLTLDGKPGYGLKSLQPFYVENLPEEITRPGEWYLDRQSGVLYLWPKATLGATSELLVSTLDDTLLVIDGASHLELRDLSLEASRGKLVEIKSGSDNRLVGCTLRNAGTTAAQIRGSRNGLARCLIEDPGDSGVSLGGGARASLTRGENYLEDSTLRRFGRVSWTYKPGVSISGCGQRVAHNLMHDAPHSAVLFSGNEHTLEYNEIHHVTQFSSDAGAIYTGRDWSYRGNEVRYNFIHDLNTAFEGFGVQGIYLDDCVAGVRVFGNVLYKIEDAGIQHGGGRDTIMENNVIARCGRGMKSDSRGIQRIDNTPGSSWNMLERLAKDGIEYQKTPWAAAYPSCAAIPNSWSALNAAGTTWLYPEGTVFSRNIGWKNGKWATESNYGGTGTFNKFKEIKDNVEDQDPLFTDEAALNLKLKSGSPALTIPGFVDIPFEKIGPRP